VAIADAAGVRQFMFCGLSLGGMIGQWLGAHVPDRVTHLVLAATSPRLADPGMMEKRRQAVLQGGMAAVVDAVLGRFFSPGVSTSDAPIVATTRRTFLTTNPVGYAGCCAAIRDMDQTASMSAIRAPTLVIGGDRDISTPWEGHGDLLTGSIPGARSVRLPVAHLATAEQPRSFTVAVLEFLLPPADNSLETGMRARRAVLGDAHVDRSMAAATDLTRDFQELITRFAWGTIWARPGLDHRSRRMLVLAITAALGRWEEFRLHLRAARAGGLEPCDVKEVLLQVAVYAGVPAANTAFQIAGEEQGRGKDE
jgi:3-oxoadipate enol-lactonase/4-carboxymuconolactone decarboxylase